MPKSKIDTAHSSELQLIWSSENLGLYHISLLSISFWTLECHVLPNLRPHVIPGIPWRKSTGKQIHSPTVPLNNLQELQSENCNFIVWLPTKCCTILKTCICCMTSHTERSYMVVICNYLCLIILYIHQVLKYACMYMLAYMVGAYDSCKDYSYIKHTRAVYMFCIKELYDLRDWLLHIWYT